MFNKKEKQNEKDDRQESKKRLPLLAVLKKLAEGLRLRFEELSDMLSDRMYLISSVDSAMQKGKKKLKKTLKKHSKKHNNNRALELVLHDIEEDRKREEESKKDDESKDDKDSKDHKGGSKGGGDGKTGSKGDGKKDSRPLTDEEREALVFSL